MRQHVRWVYALIGVAAAAWVWILAYSLLIAMVSVAQAQVHTPPCRVTIYRWISIWRTRGPNLPRPPGLSLLCASAPKWAQPGPGRRAAPVRATTCLGCRFHPFLSLIPFIGTEQARREILLWPLSDRWKLILSGTQHFFMDDSVGTTVKPIGQLFGHQSSLGEFERWLPQVTITLFSKQQTLKCILMVYF